jgi:hypothetical protein
MQQPSPPSFNPPITKVVRVGKNASRKKKVAYSQNVSRAGPSTAERRYTPSYLRTTEGRTTAGTTTTGDTGNTPNSLHENTNLPQSSSINDANNIVLQQQPPLPRTPPASQTDVGTEDYPATTRDARTTMKRALQEVGNYVLDFKRPLRAASALIFFSFSWIFGRLVAALMFVWPRSAEEALSSMLSLIVFLEDLYLSIRNLVDAPAYFIGIAVGAMLFAVVAGIAGAWSVRTRRRQVEQGHLVLLLLTILVIAYLTDRVRDKLPVNNGGDTENQDDGNLEG